MAIRQSITQENLKKNPLSSVATRIRLFTAHKNPLMNNFLRAVFVRSIYKQNFYLCPNRDE